MLSENNNRKDIEKKSKPSLFSFTKTHFKIARKFPKNCDLCRRVQFSREYSFWIYRFRYTLIALVLKWIGKSEYNLFLCVMQKLICVFRSTYLRVQCTLSTTKWRLDWRCIFKWNHFLSCCDLLVWKRNNCVKIGECTIAYTDPMIYRSDENIEFFSFNIMTRSWLLREIPNDSFDEKIIVFHGMITYYNQKSMSSITITPRGCALSV